MRFDNLIERLLEAFYAFISFLLMLVLLLLFAATAFGMLWHMEVR